jgi:molecular chaperone HscB
VEHKTAAQATSALINEAFRTLANPLLRAQYLLFLKGVNAADDERAKVEDPELLLEVMEAREAIEEAHSEGVLHGVREANDDRIRKSEAVLEEAFRVDDLPTAVEETVRLRYWVGIKESLDHWEPGGSTEVGVGHEGYP